MLSLQLLLLNLLIWVGSASAETLPQSLGWIANQQMMCGGGFAPIQLDPRTRLLREGQWQLNTKGSTTWKQKGDVDFKGPVTLLSKDQWLLSNKAKLSQDKITGKLVEIKLLHGVNLIRPMQIIHATQGLYTVNDHRLKFDDVAYRLDVQKKKHQTTHLWGQAKHFDQYLNKSNFSDVIYSTCNPENPTWHLQANEMVVDHDADQVSVYGGRLYFKSQPIIYLPYLNFSLKPERRSGWLVPRIGYDSSGGAMVTAPYYFNLAPNYDMTVDNIWYYHRGVAFNNLFRYLFLNIAGEFKLGSIIYDKRFDLFKLKTLNSSRAEGVTDRSIKALKDTSLFRWYMMAKGRVNYHEISSQYQLGYVSDDYMLRDFNWISGSEDAHHIKNSASLEYRKDHFVVGANITGFQTLQPLDERLTNYPYSRLPELYVRYFTPWGQKPWQFKVKARSIYFLNEVDGPSGLHFPSGFRYTLKPSFTMIHNFKQGYWMGEGNVHMSYYHLKHALFEDRSRMVPAMIFELGHNRFYNKLYTSSSLSYRRSRYVDQSDIPLFDTSDRPAVAEFQSSSSRFIGEDRISDENDLIGSFQAQKILSNNQSWKVLLQQRYALKLHKVCLGASCAEDHNAYKHISPFITNISKHYHSWHLISNTKWNWSKSRVDRALLRLGYQIYGSNSMDVFYLFDRHHLKKYKTDQKLVFAKKEAVIGRLGWAINDAWGVSLTSQYDINYQSTLGLGFQLKYHDCCTHLGLQLDQKPLALTPGISRKFHPSIKLFIRLDGLGNISR